MPYCAQPGCPTLVDRGRCAVHANDRERAKPNADVRRWYRTQPWRRLRLRVVVESAYQCADCKAVTLNLDVDHIRKHDGDPRLFWDRSNLQALCDACHLRKTLRGE